MGAGTPVAERRRLIRLELAADDALPGEFAPFRPPRTLAVHTSGVDGALLRTLELTLDGSLAPGHHAIPVGREVALEAELPEGAGFSLELRVGEEAGHPVLLAGELRFTHPVVLGNVPGVLAALPSLFEDKRLAVVTGWLERLASQDVPGGLASVLRKVVARATPWGHTEAGEEPRGLARVLATGEQLARIHLKRVQLRPTARGARCELAFDGYVSWVDQLPLPFSRVSLPSAVIPALHRRLDRLVAAPAGPGRAGGGRTAEIDPLATARLNLDRVATPEALAGAFGRLVERARGHVAYTLDPATLELALRLADGTRLHAEIPPLGRASGHAHVAVERDGDAMTLALEDASVSVNGGELHGRLAWTGPLPDAPAPRPPHRVAITAAPGTRLDRLELLVGLDHPWVRGETRATVALTDVVASGGGELGEGALGLDLTASAAWALAGEHRDARGRLVPRGQGHARAHAVSGDGQTLDVTCALSGAATIDAEVRHAPVPEIGLHSGVTQVAANADFAAEGGVRVERRRDGQRCVTSDSGAGEVTLRRARITSDALTVTLPAGARAAFTLHDARLSDDGLGHAEATVRWELGEAPIEVANGARAVSVPTDLLRADVRRLALSAGGGLELWTPEGAQVRPDPWRVVTDEALGRALDEAAALVDPRLGRAISGLRRFALRARRILDEEGIREPRHAVPRTRLATLSGRLLGDDPTLPDRALPIVTAVTDADGLDREAMRTLLDEVLPDDHGWEPALDRALEWLEILLSPTERLPAREPVEATPLGADPQYADVLAPTPTAAALYAAAEGARLPTGEPLGTALPRLAPYLTERQLDALLDACGAALPSAARARVRYVRELSRRARIVARSYGGFTHLLQALAIGIFLGDATMVARAACVRASDDGVRDPLAAAIPCDTLLGPRDVAILLQAGLTPVWQGRTVQLNQRLLLDYVLDRPPAFLLQVLVELSDGSQRVLASALNALLDLEQTLLREPLDIRALLTQRLGLALPCRADFMAGGPRAHESYYLALHGAAGEILRLGRPYRALRQHLQRAYAPPLRGVPASRPADGALESAAKDAVSHADALAGGLDLRDVGDDTRAAAVRAYEAAFSRCRALLEAAPDALTEPWLRDFIARNHEALVVRTAVHNHLDDVDDVRRWLAVREAGRPAPSLDGSAQASQALVERYVAALYHHPDDREALLADPLVRLLLAPPRAPLDFTIVSCMGVITDGARGRELEGTFARLRDAYGVRVIRADTATFRSLEENARRVVAAISEVRTPWGWLGYSQGCANGLAAETRLSTGTPAERRLLAGLRCRHLLFSAANGSAHGTGADLKFLRAMVTGDLALKHYERELSPPIVEAALWALRLGLDSEAFVKTLGGARSLGHEGVVALARDGRFLPYVPTTSTRGRVSPETVPEALEMLSNLLTRQTGSPDHDTQVAVDEAVAWPVHVRSAGAAVLEASAIPSRVQATHHWAPLSHDEIGFVMTERDRERAIYDSPRDRLVFPWIEVNARFGLIR